MKYKELNERLRQIKEGKEEIDLNTALLIAIYEEI